MSSDHDLRARVLDLAEEVVRALGDDLFVVEVAVRGQQGARVLEVFVDADAGVGLERLAEVSRELGFLLDAEDLVRGRYHLNVSSPGATRPLRLPRQYRQHVGRTLRVTTGTGPERATRTGTLAAVAEDALELDRDGERETIPFADVVEARVVLPW